MLIALPMVAMILWLGLYPQPVLDTARPSIQEQLQAYTEPPTEQEELPSTLEHMARVEENTLERLTEKPEDTKPVSNLQISKSPNPLIFKSSN
jgi:NADH-quinone oxidoreductase subunit M